MSEASTKHRWLKPKWIFCLLLLVLCAAFLYQLLGPSDKIIISRDTTYITGPLDQDGLPDIEAYLLQRDREGVTPENNAAVPLWQALWPADLPPEHWLPMASVLGLDDVPKEEEALVRPDDVTVRREIARWLLKTYLVPEEWNEKQWLESLTSETAEYAIDEVCSRPWTSEQLPPLAKWIGQHEKPLNLLVEAGSRPFYYSPSPSLLNSVDESLIEYLLPDIQFIRTAARALSVRAMHHLGEGRSEEAWQDIRAIHQLARHAAKNWTLVGQLVAMAVDGIACDQTQILLHHAELDEELATRILKELQSFQWPSDMAETLDRGERLLFIDTCLRIATRKEDIGALFGVVGGAGPNPLALLTRTKLDWNAILEEGNYWYDRLVDAARKPTRRGREESYGIVDQELTQIFNRFSTPADLVGGVMSVRRRSELMTGALLSFLTPALRVATNAEDRSSATLELTRLAAALAVHQARHGQYPDNLEDLVPDVLSELPQDIYSGKQFLYQRKDDGGYLLYSIYEDGVDDGGSSHDGGFGEGQWIVRGEWTENPNGVVDGEGDLVIRVPVPEFKLPDPPKVGEEQ